MYKTVLEHTDVEEVITRSRFIASLRHVESPDEIKAAQLEVAKTYQKANHHCWAYRLNSTPVLEHSSDAGEPSGTAGRPILGAMKKHSLINVLIVVTRYFGGIKLGVKGLIAAYGGVALLAVENSKIVEREAMSRIDFCADYHTYNIFSQWAQNNELIVEDIKFDERVSGTVEIATSKLNVEMNFLKELSTSPEHFNFFTSEE